MIVVKIELWHATKPGKVTELGRMYIANDGTTTDAKLGSYDVAVCRKGSIDIPHPVKPDGNKATRVGRVENYPRLSYNVWRLILRALKSAFPEENKNEEK